MSAPASDRMAELRKRFQGGNKDAAAAAAPTPENQFGRMKKSKEEQAKAVAIAKARAARYNMTLRSLAIKTTTDVQAQEKKDRLAKIEAQKRAAKYNMTSRALPVATVTRGSKDQDVLAKALGMDVSPSIAKEVIAAVAKKEHKRSSMMRAPVPVKPEAVEAVATAVSSGTPKGRATAIKKQTPPAKVMEEVHVAPTPAPVEPEKKIVMGGLGEALKSGDEEAINKAILVNFLETSAPHLVGKADSFMEVYKHHMQDLFDKLVTQFPDAHDAEVNGRNKADKEVAEAAAPAPVKKAEPKPEPVKVEPAKVEKKAEPTKVEKKAEPVKVEKKPEPVVEVEEEQDDAVPGGDVEATGEDDDSFVADYENIDEFNPNDKKQPLKIMSKEEIKKSLIEDFGDEDSLVADNDNEYKAGYDNVIKNAEKNPEQQKRISSERRKSMKKADLELSKALTKMEAEEEEPERRGSAESESSLAVVEETAYANLQETAAAFEGGYIVAAELEEDEKDDEPVSRWAVQLQNKNYALKQKLLKQGLSKNQVDELVENLESNTSEML